MGAKQPQLSTDKSPAYNQLKQSEVINIVSQTQFLHFLMNQNNVIFFLSRSGTFTNGLINAVISHVSAATAAAWS